MDDVLMIRLFSALIAVVFVVLVIASMWKVFSKAGQPGWAALIPIYNTYVLLKIGGMSGWWLLLIVIPLLNIPILIVETYHIAKSFGKSGAFGFFLLFLFPIGYMILGFGSSQYLGPAAYLPRMEAQAAAAGRSSGVMTSQVPVAMQVRPGTDLIPCC